MKFIDDLYLFLKANNRWFSIEQLSISLGLEPRITGNLARALVTERRASYFINYRGEYLFAYIPELENRKAFGRGYYE